MRKILTILLLLALAVPMWAGEKTITISRNDVDWESANTVYNITKGGVQLKMSGGMNNPNFLLMKQHTTITVKSHNFNIKRIVFHCLDNFTNDNLDPFYWGPTTLHIQYNQSHAETAGTLTYNYGGSSYDALWKSTKNSSPGNYPDGLPAGYELMFENEGKPVRFASIDIVVEQEVGDMFELVTSQNEVTTGTTYMLVNRESYATTQGYALSVNATGETANDDLLSTPVELIDDGMRVKANSETQFITFEASGDTSYPYCVKAGSNYIRTQSSLVTTTGRRGYHLTKVANKPSADYVNTKVTINTNGIQTNWGYYAAIKYQGSAFADYAFRHIATYTDDNNTYTYYQFRNMYDQAYSDRRVYLYKPSKQYKVTTEVQPDANHGSISLSDGILVDNGINWSQKMDTVQFLVTAADGYKISNIAIQAKDDNGTVVETISPLSETITINGTLYTFVMPGYDTHIIATFEEVTYHDVNIVVKPSSLCGNIFLTEGYVVQNDQVKSYDGQNVVFNVTPNPINPADESEGYYELSYVTVTDNVTGVETTLVPDANGNYTFTMPDNEVTITANFRVKLMISTACDPSYGGYFEQSTMTCNGQSTNFYNGAQYYVDDVMTFMVKTNYGYQINKVIVTDNYGTQTTLTPTESYSDGNFYSFSMPNSNVTITAYFYNSVSDLYLLGTANHGKWMTSNGGWLSYGPKFNYGPDTETYSLDVYFTGTEHNDDGFGYFSLTKVIDESGNWNISAGNRLVADQNNTYIADDDENATQALYSGNERSTDNAFKIPAGVYTIKVNKAMNQITVEEWPFELVFDPAGGTTELPVVVSDGTVVSISSALYDAIYSINPDDAENVAYKYSTDGVNYTNGQSTTLYKGDQDEILVTINGNNYLGHIQVPGEAIYKITDTPLHWIEEFGKKDNTYTVSDRLQGVYAQEGHLWCKDLGDQSIVKTSPNTDAGQIDFLGTTLKTANHRFAENMRINDWDQSNWVELDFTALGTQNEALSKAQSLVNKYITAGSVTGVYSDDVNYTIKLTANPTADGDASYVPNTYCTANFLEGNLTAAGVTTGEGENAKNYYFLNPKVQEYAIVTFAMWDKTNQIMVIPDNTPFNGAVKFGRWDWNNPSGQLDMLNNDNTNPLNAYEFHVIVQRANKSYGTPATASGVPALRATDSPSGKTDQTASTVIMAQPLDLEVEHPLPTGINGVVSDAKVVGVEYVNIAGMRSSKPFKGVNIVVTRYSDGSTTTSKVIK